MMKNLSDILAEMERQGFELGKVYTDKDRPPFQVTETEELQRWKVYIQGEKKPLILTGKDSRSVKKFAHQMIKNNKVKIKKVVKEGNLIEGWTKVKFDDVEVGTKITYQMKVVYIVTKLYPGGFLMKIYKSGDNPGMFAPKARIEKDNYESQVKMGFIKGVKV